MTQRSLLHPERPADIIIIITYLKLYKGHIINSVTHYSITTTGDVGKPREAPSRFFGLIRLEYRFLYLQRKNSFVFRINFVSLHFSLTLKEFVRKCLEQIPIPLSVPIEQCSKKPGFNSSESYLSASNLSD